jgi:hypothetical protein
MSAIELGNFLRCPRGTPNSGVMELDLSEVNKLESRKGETASVTKTKAPELMHAMERGYSLIAARLLPQVQWELTKAKEAADQRKAVVMLDEAPRILKEKGLSTSRNPAGSADQRENILALDTEYQKLRNTVDMLDAVYELLKGKMRGFEMSYQSVKRVFDSLNSYGALSHANPSVLSTSIPDDAGAGDVVHTGVGIPKY